MNFQAKASAEYFKRVAGEWDQIRAGYFGDDVRQAAFERAYLRPEMVVADVGGGSGYMTEGLAPLVSRVHLIDACPEMLAVARKNLSEFTNVVFHEAEGRALPLADQSVDAVFANMYLHHCPNPSAAIGEMARLLKPGGRLVITDMMTHLCHWFRDEMADIWLGFEPRQVDEWLQQAGLVNRLVGSSGTSCCVESQNAANIPAEDRRVQICVFLAVGARRIAGVEAAVQSGYAEIVSSATGGCCSANDVAVSCCEDGGQAKSNAAFIQGYDLKDLSQIPEEASAIAMGCGNPHALDDLRGGETVLDIGSGGGMDVFFAAQRVGEQGRVIGVDMTPEMVARAQQTAQRHGFSQVEFRLGKADRLPLEDESVDLVISNCVVNLCADKGAVFREAYRVLKPGGRLAVSDLVAATSIPFDASRDPQRWMGCLYGALPEREYLDLIEVAGFAGIESQRTSSWGDAAGVAVYSMLVSAKKEVRVESARVC